MKKVELKVLFDLTLSVLQCVVKAIASSKIYNAHVLVVCVFFCWVFVLLCSICVFLNFIIILLGKRELVAFTLVIFLTLCSFWCSASLPHYAVGWICSL